MNLSELKNKLANLNDLRFFLPEGNEIPAHFHITEVGQITRHFIDCGGVERLEKTVNFQIWIAQDLEHRLAPEKLKSIIEKSEKTLRLQDAEIEVEYQRDTIGKFGLEFRNGAFWLTNKFTNCLAPDGCGIPQEKRKINLSSIVSQPTSCCQPGSSCC